jgi:phosphatidylinositol glycan class B
MIRPWFQPYLYLGETRILQALGIQSPFAWATSYRLLSALIGWLSIVGLCDCIPLWMDDRKWQKITTLMLCLCWYLPALHARHSSENLGGSLFVIGLCLLTWLGRLDTANQRRIHPWALVGCGAIWGLAFEARYQVGIMIAGGLLWLTFVAHLRWRDLGLLALGIFAAIAFGTSLDTLGYGQFTFAPWNYFEMNLLQNYVSSSGTSPFWDYFRRIWTETWPILGFVTLMGLILSWAAVPLHFLTWSYLPFFAVHMIIAHKETRFLFPLVHAAPVCLAIFLASISGEASDVQQGKPVIWKNRWLKLTTLFVITLNFIALVISTLSPMTPAIRFYKAVYDRRIAELRYLPGHDPYVVLGIPMYFYKPEDLKLVEVAEHAPTQGEISPFYLAYPRNLAPEPFGSLCAPLVSALSPFVARNLKHLNNWTLFQCKSSKAPERQSQ